MMRMLTSEEKQMSALRKLHARLSGVGVADDTALRRFERTRNPEEEAGVALLRLVSEARDYHEAATQAVQLLVNCGVPLETIIRAARMERR